ncbi:hypothetical protein CORC01_06854 [Colletotrichum orchidophilum]|uniref:Uncharacterized protein n=1 Tax=Colletotrichum orchidophilum TaxID=1209926 RepID=A0A1G4B8P7_9PEZI|nr:uncharacterized protein CORC01_06854 [Colletotrichum orchidophilum]OHE97819.1 hypothetical protein CORC01_06854 [Colletotrichum orchidophilum]
MSEPEPALQGPGVLHSTSAPLSSALRVELFAAIEAIYAIGGGSDTSHAIKSETGSHPTTTDTDHYSASSHSLDTACSRLTDVMKHWDLRIQDRSLSRQHAVYHFHPPSNVMEFESWVMGQSMSTADSTLIARLIDLCPQLGFEVLPVVMKYTGTTCQYQVRAPLPPDGNVGPQLPEQNGYWKAYQHVKHSPSIHYFGSFDDLTLAETVDCHEGNVLDERNVAWERARRGIFSWQGSYEQQLFDEERRLREANPRWYQNIIPGTSGDLGYYFAPAIIITPLRTQLEFVNMDEPSQSAIRIWRYLLRQCKASPESAFYFEVLQSLCRFVWPERGNELPETQILGTRVQNRQELIDKVDSGLMGDLMLTSLVFKNHQLFQSLIASTPVEPLVDYSWICQNASFHGYSAANALYELRSFLFERNNFLQVASIVDKLPPYSVTDSSSKSVEELGKMTIGILKSPVSATHGRVVVNLLKLFKDFDKWSDMVDSAMSRHGEIQQHSQFMLGLFNRLFEVAKRDRLPLDQVTAFYQKHAGVTDELKTLWDIGKLVSNANEEQSAEAKAARQAWCIAEPTEETIVGHSKLTPTNHTMIAGLFRNLDRLGMDDQVNNLAEHIAQHVTEIEPIHLARLWLPLLRTLQDLVDPDKPAYQHLFQAIFERYESAVFEDVSGRIEQEPKLISPMAACCRQCETLNSYFDQPSWKTIHLVKPRMIVDHIQSQLQNQGKPIKVVIYGRNEASLTMQLTKSSLANERLRTIGALRRQEATRAVQQFDPDVLLSFLGDKGEIMWKLGDAESQRPLKGTSARLSDSSSTRLAAGSSRTSSSSTPGVSLRSLETPRRGYQEPPIRDEITSHTNMVQAQITPRIEDRSITGMVKPEPSASLSLAQCSGHRDIRDMSGASVNKEQATPSSSTSQGGLLKSSGTSARDRLKKLGRMKLESTPKFDDDDEATARLRAKLDKRLTPRETPQNRSGSSSRLDYSLPRTRNLLAPFGGRGSSREPASSFNKQAGLTSTLEPILSFQSTASGFSRTPRLDAVAGGPTPRPSPLLNALSGGSANSGSSRLGLGVRTRSPSSSPSPATAGGGSNQPDYMAAIMDVKRAKKLRSGSTWEVRSALGSIVGSGTASSAAAKSRFSGLVDAIEQENPRLTSLMNESPDSHSASGIARATSGALTARSHNVRPDRSRISGTVSRKRHIMDDDDDNNEVIDLCGGNSSYEGGNKRMKTTPTFTLLDDDPFGED